MRSDILTYVQSCQVCSQAKPDRARYPGLLQPLPVPRASWEIISLDFMEGLPTSNSVNAVMVVVDKYSKFAHFVPLRHPFIAVSVAQLFFDHIYRLHGLPVSIISDRDRIFTSKFWQQLFRLAGVTLRISSAYHPQTDGQTERVNQCMETFLRCFVHSCPRRWLLGCQLPNSGIILPCTLLWAGLLSKYCMVFRPGTWGSISIQLLQFQSCLSGWKKGNSCIV